MNNFTVTGRLARKPELISGENYVKVHLNVGSDKTVKKGDTYEKGTAWNSVTVFGRQAENCAQYLEKGQWVELEGDLENVKTNKTTSEGKPVFETYLTARKVHFGPKATGSNNTQAPKENLDSIPF